MEGGYREWGPHPLLQPYVECYWTHSAKAPATHTPPRLIVPDGCTDIILFYQDEALRVPSKAATVVGTMTQPITVQEDWERDVVGVRFHPGGGTPFTEVPGPECRDRLIPLGAIWGSAGSRLWDEVGDGATAQERVRRLEAELLSRLPHAARAADTIVLRCTHRMRSRDGRGSIQSVTASLGLSLRQTQRRFRAATGMTMKEASRIMRVRNAARLLGNSHASLATLAITTGFSDQAHLATEFRRLTGLTPGQYRRQATVRI